MISVLLVEDHAAFRGALTMVLRGEGDLEVVAEVGRVDQAGTAAGETRPTLAIVDIALPNGSGADAIAAIRERSPTTRAVVLSGVTDDVQLGRCIEAGAAAVIDKSRDVAEVVDVLRQVAGGATVLHTVETSRRLVALKADRDRHWRARLLREQLTSRELVVLGELARGGSTEKIAERLTISPQTVQTHIRNVMAKMDVGTRLDAVVEAQRLGLVDPPG